MLKASLFTLSSALLLTALAVFTAALHGGAKADVTKPQQTYSKVKS